MPRLSIIRKIDASTCSGRETCSSYTGEALNSLIAHSVSPSRLIKAAAFAERLEIRARGIFNPALKATIERCASSAQLASQAIWNTVSLELIRKPGGALQEH